MEEHFWVPEAVREACAARVVELGEAYAAWQELAERYRAEYPDLWPQWEAMCAGERPADLEARLLAAVPAGSDATRKFSGAVLQEAAEAVPWLVGGSADLAPSNNTMLKKYDAVLPGSYAGRNLHFGVREHAMGAIMNGLLESGFRAYGGTFEIFSDYMRPALRLAALSHLPAIYVFTHDSIFLGEDGPTHQPVEQHWALRAIPNLYVMRPADGPETALAWTIALERKDGPTALLLTRQKVREIDHVRYGAVTGARQGGYILLPAEDPELVIVATGSEVGLALGVAEELLVQGRRVQVVSMPCTELFDQQPEDYRRAVLRPDCPRRMSIEAGITHGWERYVGEKALLIGLDHFGASAPYKALAEEFGFTVPQIVERVKGWAEELA